MLVKIMMMSWIGFDDGDGDGNKGMRETDSWLGLLVVKNPLLDVFVLVCFDLG
jgi:hypothetical protein